MSILRTVGVFLIVLISVHVVLIALGIWIAGEPPAQWLGIARLFISFISIILGVVAGVCYYPYQR